MGQVGPRAAPSLSPARAPGLLAARLWGSFPQVPCCSLFSCGPLSLQAHPRGVRQGLWNLLHAGKQAGASTPPPRTPIPYWGRALLKSIPTPSPCSGEAGTAVPQIRRGSPAVGAPAGPAEAGTPRSRSHSASAVLFRGPRTVSPSGKDRERRHKSRSANSPGPRRRQMCSRVMSTLPGRPPRGLTACQTR